MCVIINKPSKIHISEETLEDCWNANPHGAGFMYVKDNALVIQKGYMEFESFLQAYKQVNEDIPIVIHFRLASCGKIVPEQTHPLLIRPLLMRSNLAFVHNGHMHIKYITEDVCNDKSDTIVFMEKILQVLPSDFLQNKAIQELISGYVGSSVLLFMDNMGNITILGNQEDSVIYEGCWFSNDHWMLQDFSDDQIEGDLNHMEKQERRDKLFSEEIWNEDDPRGCREV